MKKNFRNTLLIIGLLLAVIILNLGCPASKKMPLVNPPQTLKDSTHDGSGTITRPPTLKKADSVYRPK